MILHTCVGIAFLIPLLSGGEWQVCEVLALLSQRKENLGDPASKQLCVAPGLATGCDSPICSNLGLISAVSDIGTSAVLSPNTLY